MQTQTERRVHSAEVKAAVLAECQEPGASIAAVALRHGLNANLVRKWLVGRGLKKAGLVAPRAATLEFVPVGLSGSARGAAAPERTSSGDIDIELQRGNARLTVRWPGGLPCFQEPLKTTAQAGRCSGLQ